MGTSQYPEWSGPPLLNFWQGDPLKNVPLWNYVRWPGNQRKFLLFALETDPDGASTTPSQPLPTGVTLTGVNTEYVTYPGSGGTNGTYTGIQFRVTDTRNGVHRTSPLTQVKIAGAIVLTPSQPANFAVVAKSATEIEVSWTAGTGGSVVTAYHLFRAPAQSGPYEEISANAVSTYSDTGLDPDTDYWYTVAAEDAAHAFSGSTVAKSAHTFAGPPAMPVGVSAYGVDADVIRVSWVAGSGGPAVDHFVLYHAASEGGSYTPVNPATSPYDHSGNDPLQTKFYKVRAVDHSGVESAYSAIVSAATLALATPGTPTAVTVTPVSSTALSVAWTASEVAPIATSFKIFRATEQNGTYDQIGTDTASPYVDTSRVANTTYWYRVVAVVAAQDSGQSVEGSGTTHATAPGAPLGLVAAGQSTSAIEITWSPPSVLGTPPLTYKLWVSDTGADGSFTLLSGTATSPHDHTGLAANTTKYYRVSAVDANSDEGPRTGNPPAMAVTDAALTPTKPENFTVRALSQTEIQLDWTRGVEGSTPQSYRVYRELSSSGAFTNSIASPTGVQYVDTGRIANTTYYYRVAAYDGTTIGPQSLTMQATTDPVSIPVAEATFIIKPSTATRTLVGTSTAGWVFANGTPATRPPRGGDVIEIQAGTHGVIIFKSLSGASTDRIVIRGPQTGTAQAIIKTGGTTFPLQLYKPRDVTIDGELAGAPEDCGIKVTCSAGSTPSQFIKMRQMPKRTTVRYCEIAGVTTGATSNGGIAIGLNDNQDNRMKDYIGEWVEDITLEYNYVHNCGSFYCGNNYEPAETGGLECPLRRIRIEHNKFMYCEQEFIGLKQAWQGPNYVRYNYGHTSGIAKSGTIPQRGPMSIQGSTAIISHNVFINAGDGSNYSPNMPPNGTTVVTRHGPDRVLGVPNPGTGVSVPNWNPAIYGIYAYFDVEMFNNLYYVGALKGINVQRSTDQNAPGIVNGPPYLRFKGYNNTVCQFADDGINIVSGALYSSGTGSFVRNNVLRQNGTNLSGDAAAFASVNSLGSAVGANGTTFVNPNAATLASRDYHLAATIPVAASSTLGTNVANNDLDGDTRVLATADMGAYEYP